MVSANSSTSAGGLARAVMGMRPTRWGASQAMTLRSSRTSRATDGRCTLTTTASPVARVAACTWAIDAAASGASSKEANTSASGRPRSSSTTVRTLVKVSGGTRSRQCLNSSTSSGGKIPSPELMIWASLM